MSDKNIQDQIDQINHKLDLVLKYVSDQRLKSEEVEDFIADASIVGKDLFQTAVYELDKSGVEVNPDEAKALLIKFTRNIGNFSQMIDMIESVNDFLQDAKPIANELIIDLINKLHEFETRGYFEYIKEWSNLLGKVHEYFTVEDFKNLSGNVEIIMNILKNLSSTDFLNKVEKATHTLNTMNIDDEIDNKSLFKLFKELKSPEVRKSISYSLRLIKAINK